MSTEARPSRQRPGAACQECRRRKLRCDRRKPQCGTCEASDTVCVLPADPVPRGPKRGYLKEMEARVAALEGAKASTEQPAQNIQPQTRSHSGSVSIDESWSGLFEPADMSQPLAWDYGLANFADVPGKLDPVFASVDTTFAPIGPVDTGLGIPNFYGMQSSLDNFSFLPPPPLSISSESRTDEMTDMGSLGTMTPPMGVEISSLKRAELDQLYFDRTHDFMPIVHQRRYTEATRNTITQTKAQSLLQRTMWTLAASSSAHYQPLCHSLYNDAKSLMRDLEQRESWHTSIELEHVQAWMLMAVYELMFVDFRLGWCSAGRAFRLIQLEWSRDIAGPTDPTTDWIRLEQKRRTYWVAYCIDRLISLQTGSLMTFSEQDVIALPILENDFRRGCPVAMPTLSAAVSDHEGMRTSPFIDCIVVATFAGRALSAQQSMQNLNSTPISPLGSPNMISRPNDLIDSVLRRAKAFTDSHPIFMQDTDPMLMFVGTMWQALALNLLQIARPQDQPEVMDVNKDGERAREIVRQLLTLASELSNSNWFKVHPLTPVPLSISADILAAQCTEEADRAAAVVMTLKQNLVNFNKLGQGLAQCV